MQTPVEHKISLKKGDLVQVMSGKEKGKQGKVLGVNVKTGRVLIEKVNMVKRHVKPDQKNPQGGILEKEVPLNASKVLLYCAKCNKGVRHGVKMTGTGDKAIKGRACKKCGTGLDA